MIPSFDSRRLLTFLALASLLLSGCGDQSKTPGNIASKGPVDAGTLLPGSYSSDYFNFSFTFPQHWQAADHQTLRQQRSEMLTALEAQNSEVAAQMRESFERTHYLLTLIKPPSGTSLFSPNIVCTVEEIASQGIKTAEAYLQKGQDELEKSGLPISMTGEPRTGRVGNRDFLAQGGQMTAPGMNVRQFFYVTIIGDHALVFTLSYTNSTEFNDLLRALQSIHFS